MQQQHNTPADFYALLDATDNLTPLSTVCHVCGLDVAFDDTHSDEECALLADERFCPEGVVDVVSFMARR